METNLPLDELQEQKQEKLQSFARIADKLIDDLFNYSQMSGKDFEENRKSYFNEITDLQNVITEINNNLKS
ncbi:hypothetical protein Q73A0000_01390 [Kaistella flava (ex Peng et al. 2021)]|uniref:Uncharacterized protein n=1 Tax=Kaistella flava (ex Peng et al. 2021) TaxID=2038776 RepID=A0A7M2Y4S2_9FLAO|nr:hypothetical protein [Kaistella flava (ex Peng et al. 2021)]QOW09096.1 hypothetical protein Q73A0000_01390 [Kaistella flava (ex Peng et al. 2021)]